MNRNHLSFVVAGVCALAISAQAATDASSFGPLPGGTTFAGSGIPTNHVEITTVSDLPSSDVLTLGLSATPYKLPSSLNDDASTATFYSLPGASSFSSSRATWNFDYFIGINNASDLGNYTFDMTVDNGTTTTDLSPVAIALNDGGKAVATGTYQDSENIDFYGYSFGPGTYTIDLTASDAGVQVGSDDITVVVTNSVPDNTSTLTLTAVAVAGLLIASRRKLA